VFENIAPWRAVEVDSAQAGILTVRCRGTQPSRVTKSAARQRDGSDPKDGKCRATKAAPHRTRALVGTVKGLAKAIDTLEGATRTKKTPQVPFLQPYASTRPAGWHPAGAACEILPISLAAKQKLMEAARRAGATATGRTEFCAARVSSADVCFAAR